MFRMLFRSTVFAAVLFAVSSAHAQTRVPGDLIHYDLQGQRFRLSDWVDIGPFPPLPGQSGPVVLVFGAHWCVPCHGVMRLLHERRPALEDAGIRVVYVHVDDVDRGEGLSRQEIRALVEADAARPEFRGVRVLLGGDAQEVRQWHPPGPADDSDAHPALPGVSLIRVDGYFFYRTLGFSEELPDQLNQFIQAVQRPAPQPPAAPRPPRKCSEL